jgi:hypothetical protein
MFEVSDSKLDPGLFIDGNRWIGLFNLCFFCNFIYLSSTPLGKTEKKLMEPTKMIGVLPVQENNV